MKLTIGVIGESETTPERYEFAYSVGREIARRGCVLVCGGMGGVMEAACKGASKEGGLTVGIVPGASGGDANPYVDVPIVTGMGHGRNVIVARSSNAIVAVGGNYGTLSEIAFALKLGIPIVGFHTWEVSSDIKKAKTPREAVDVAYSLARGGDRP